VPVCRSLHGIVSGCGRVLRPAGLPVSAEKAGRATWNGGPWQLSRAQSRLDDPDRLGAIDADAGDECRVLASGAYSRAAR
jgi:hypothetical protein